MFGQFLYTVLFYSVAIIALIVVPNFFLKPKSRTNKKTLGLNGWPLWRDIGLALAGLIFYLILSYILTTAFSAIFPWFQAEETQATGFEAAARGSDLVFAFLSLVVIAPIAEEVLFRGFLYGWLQKIRLKNDKNFPRWIAIVLVSVLFAFLHGQWNVAISVFALSIVLCVLRNITGTIHASIILHMIKNAIAFALIFGNINLQLLVQPS